MNVRKLVLSTAPIVVAVLVWSLHASSPPAAAQGAEKRNLAPERDAFVSSSQPGRNFGRSQFLYVGQVGEYGATRSLVYFDLKDLDKKYVVTGGELRLYLRAAGPGGDTGRDIVLYRIEEDWGEESVTWNDFPDWRDQRVATRGVGTGSGWYSWDIDSLSRDWYREKVKNRGLYVQGYEAAGSFRSFESREGSPKPELRLDVVIDNKPPVAVLDPLKPFIGTPDIVLTWQPGTDPDPSSGIVTYEIWSQRGSDPWQLGAKDIKERTYAFRNAENGRVYGFQVLAVDRAGNRQPLAGAQTTTLVDRSAPEAALAALPAWTAGPPTLRPGGRDLPEGGGLQNSGIKHFDIDYNVGGGAWAPLAYFHAVDVPFVWNEAPEGVLLQFRVRAIDRADNVGLWTGVAASTTVDRSPPIAWIHPTSGVDAPTFRVSWGGDDAASGLDSFDLEYRVGTAAWQTWVSGTRDRSKEFVGEYGRVYSFRVRARDQAGNVSVFPAAPQLVVAPVPSSSLTHPLSLPYVETRHQGPMPRD